MKKKFIIILCLPEIANDQLLQIVETVAQKTDQTDPEKFAVIYGIVKATNWNADEAIKNIEEGKY